MSQMMEIVAYRLPYLWVMYAGVNESFNHTDVCPTTNRMITYVIIFLLRTGVITSYKYHIYKTMIKKSF